MTDEEFIKVRDDWDKAHPEHMQEMVARIEEIKKKYGINEQDQCVLLTLNSFLSMLGYGRNERTINIYKAAVEMMELPVVTRDTIEAWATNKLQ